MHCSRMLDISKEKYTTESHWSQKANMWNPFVTKWNAATTALRHSPAGLCSPATNSEVSNVRDFEPARAAIATVTVLKVLMKVSTFVKNTAAPSSVSVTGTHNHKVSHSTKECTFLGSN